MTDIRHLPLEPVSVPVTATFAEAALELTRTRLPAIAVLAGDGTVAGVFTSDGLLRGSYPGYLAELRHTAFLEDDEGALAERAEEVRDTPVAEFLEEVEPLDASDSRVHAAERLLHAKVEALPVVEGGRFVGMLSIEVLCAAAVERFERLERAEGPAQPS